MNKFLFFFSLTFLSSATAFSQKEKFTVLFSYGAAMPVGDFAAKDILGKYSGVAKSGSYYEVTAQYRLWKNWGVIAGFVNQQNPTDEQALSNQFNSLVQNATATFQISNWRMKSGFIGIVGFLPLDSLNRWSFDYRLMGGYTNSILPEEKATILRDTTVTEFSQNSASANASSYLIGIGFKRNIHKLFCIHLEAEYFGSKPTFKDITSSTKLLSITSSATQYISSINISVGVGLRF